ncbi:MAG: NUDIX hydrolase [Flavobacteriales bacterium]|nr:NUDIX hydrolase [Flavobacteriales bacterium]
MHEEIGLTKLDLIRKLGSYTRPRLEVGGNPNINEIKTIHIYLFTTQEQSLTPIDPDNPEARWVTKDNVNNYLTHEADKEFFELHINDL